MVSNQFGYELFISRFLHGALTFILHCNTKGMKINVGAGMRVQTCQKHICYFSIYASILVLTKPWVYYLEQVSQLQQLV